MSTSPKELGQLFLSLYPVDENGYSQIALMEDLIKVNPDFKTTNGCQWARSNQSWLGKQFNISRIKKGRCIYSVQLVGYNSSISNHLIPSNIEDNLKDNNCSILDISTNLEIDHKNGRYDSDKYTLDDFQILCKTANDAKRQHCKECKNTGIRYDAKRLGSNISYVYGDANSTNCIGCYWYDPKEFWRIATKNEL